MRSSLVIAALLGLLFAQSAQGATKAIRSDVYGVLTGTSYAGCMVQVGEIPWEAGLDCPTQSRTWLTMDCNGNWLDHNTASNNLKMAQIALLTGDKITVTVDDSKKANGNCLARQIILFR